MRQLALLIVVLLPVSVGSARADGPAPLSAEHQALFDGTPADPAPPVLDGPKGLENTHYVAGNEWHLQLFRKALARRKGGAYVGVGTDQAYLFMGWQRPEVAWLVDYDQVVVDIHALYRAFFLEADTPGAFLALWTKPHAARARDVIAARLSALGQARVAALQARYDKYRGRIRQRLFKLRRILREEKLGAFLNRRGRYTFVRDLVASGRVRAVRVNLLVAGGGLAAIGRAARGLGLTIRVLYLSNAEQYWRYNDAFRENVTGLPRDERSLVLRTFSTWKLNQDYRYFAQRLERFVGWLSRPWVTSVNLMLPPRKDETSAEPDYRVIKRTIARAQRRRSQQGKERRR